MGKKKVTNKLSSENLSMTLFSPEPIGTSLNPEESAVLTSPQSEQGKTDPKTPPVGGRQDDQEASPIGLAALFNEGEDAVDAIEDPVETKATLEKHELVSQGSFESQEELAKSLEGREEVSDLKAEFGGLPEQLMGEAVGNPLIVVDGLELTSEKVGSAEPNSPGFSEPSDRFPAEDPTQPMDENIAKDQCSQDLLDSPGFSEPSDPFPAEDPTQPMDENIAKDQCSQDLLGAKGESDDPSKDGPEKSKLTTKGDDTMKNRETEKKIEITAIQGILGNTNTSESLDAGDLKESTETAGGKTEQNSGSDNSPKTPFPYKFTVGLAISLSAIALVAGYLFPAYIASFSLVKVAGIALCAVLAVGLLAYTFVVNSNLSDEKETKIEGTGAEQSPASPQDLSGKGSVTPVNSHSDDKAAAGEGIAAVKGGSPST
ncbi:hypothetical protein N9Y17_00700 [Gammaproteobacteria bacterium]|nr:hypothetical protein [Gammaproteobacteria bacterium]